ncbi:hypothetical protein HGB47_09470 [Leptospira yasudae]|uniref:LIC12611 family phage tail protein n=1 Tax=Leptospira yasudae TaxID=2202201 RepID=UPI001C4E397A|nr:hypothetical protein [Leptospira yasudae]MBW0433845.1 hypothetical protein [Leptospira yasudae]
MAAREINITIKIDANDSMSEIQKELDDLRGRLLDFSDSFQLFSKAGAAAMRDFGGSIADSIGKFSTPLSQLADRLKTSEASLTSLYSKVKGNAALEKQFFDVAKAAGFTQRDIAKLDFQLNATARTSALLSGALKNLAQIGMTAFKSVIAPAWEAGIALEKQKEVLKSLSGGEGFGKLQASIESAIQSSKGLATQKDLTQAANEAIKAGASVDFITRNLSGLQKASRLSGNELSSSMKQAYDAIKEGSTEFLKNNGDLFSSYSEEFKRINESGMSAIDKRLAREKLITDALNENSKLQDAYGAHVRTTSAVVDRFGNRIEDLKSKFGTLLLDALNPAMNSFADLYDYYTENAEGIEELKEKVIVFGSILAGVLGAIAVKMVLASGITLSAMIPALLGMAAAGWMAIAPWIPAIVIGTAVGIVIAGLILIIRDLFKWMSGSKSVIGAFLGPFNNIKKLFNDLALWFQGLPDMIVKFFKNLGPKIKEALKGMIPGDLLKIFGVASVKTDKVETVEDAIITKQGKVVKFHPDDNLVAVKDLGVLGGSKSNKGGGISVNIANVVLSSATRREDAAVFASYLEKELDKIALKIGLASGLAPEVG